MITAVAALAGQAYVPCAAQETVPRPRHQMGALDRALAKLHNGERAVREEGQRELVAAGRSAVSGLKEALGEDEGRVREAAAGALAGIGAPAVKKLLAALESDDPNCWRAAALALVMLICDVRADPGPTEAAEALLRLTHRGPAPMRQRAISIIGHMCANPASCPPSVLSRGRDALLAALGDSDADVQWHAVHGLGRVSRELAEAQRGLINERLHALLASSEAELRGAAAWALHRENAAAASMDLDAEASVACLALAVREGADEPGPVVTEQVTKRGAAIAAAIVERLAADVVWPDALASVAALRATGPAARAPLLAALGSADAAIRSIAATALGATAPGGDDDAVQALHSALHDGDGAVRLAAAKTLGTAVAQSGPLVDLLGDRYDYVRDGAADALVELGDPAVAPLVQALGSARASVRELAAVSLGRVGTVRAVRPLISLLSDTSPRIRTAAAEALGHIRSTVAVEPLIEAVQDSAPGVRVGAAAALGAIGDARAVAPLIRTLRDANVRVRTAAVAALGLLGAQTSGEAASRAAEALLMAMRVESGVCSPSEAAEALGRMGPVAVRPLLLLLRDTDARVRAAAIQGLGATGAVEAAEALVGLLADPNPKICAAVALALLAFRDTEGAPEAVGALIEGLGNEDERVRARSAAAMGQMVSGGSRGELGPEVAVALGAALTDTAPGVRVAAATALGDLRDPGSVDALIAAVADPSFDVRRAAAVALQRIRTPEALAALRDTGPPIGGTGREL